MLKKNIISVLIFIGILFIGTNVLAFTIVIDPGHGGTEPGAVAENGVLEKDLNLKISRYLKEYLEQYQVDVYMTHNGFSGYQYSIFDRAIFARNKKADLVLSLHLNDTKGEGYGAEVYVTANKSLDKYNKNMTQLGNKVLNNLSELGIFNRGVKTSVVSDVTDVYSDGTRADYMGIIRYCMRGCKIDYGVISPSGTIPADIKKGEGVPATVIEHCFLTGSDYKYLDTEEELKKLAIADGKAVVEQFGLKKKTQGETPFEDVSKNDWYYNAIKYCYENKLIEGINETTFEPNTKLTRGMLVTILWRKEGSPLVAQAGTNFPDVSNKIWYSQAVKWASSKKIVSGYKNGKFGPNDTVTRQDLAVILRNYTNYKKKDTNINTDLTKFKDYKDIAPYARTAMQWAVGKGVITGNAGNNTLTPTNTATRGQAASMLYKYCMNIK